MFLSVHQEQQPSQGGNKVLFGASVFAVNEVGVCLWETQTSITLFEEGI